MATPSPNAAAETKKVNLNGPAFTDANTAADNHRDQDSEPRKIMHSRKAKVMLQQKDDTFAPESSANVRTREPKEASVVGSSPHLIVCFAAPEKMAASNNASPRETVSLPETVYVTAKRVRLVRLSERVENSLYLLILAAALGYLVIAILGL